MRNRNQAHILMALFHTESAFAVFNILHMFPLLLCRVASILEIYFSMFCNIYSFMVLFVSDRFLVFYLNMKYPIFCTPKKMLKIIFSAVFVPIILVLILAFAIQFKLINLLNMLIIM